MLKYVACFILLFNFCCYLCFKAVSLKNERSPDTICKYCPFVLPLKTGKYSASNYLSPTESTLFSLLLCIVTAQKFSSPTGISWNWKVLSLVAAAQDPSLSAAVCILLFTQTLPFSLAIFKLRNPWIPELQLVQTLPQTPPIFQYLPLWMQEGLVLCRLCSASSLAGPGLCWPFSLGISPTTVEADLPTLCLIIGLVWVSESLGKNDPLDTAITDVAFSCLSLYVIHRHFLWWSFVSLKKSCLNPPEGFCVWDSSQPAQNVLLSYLVIVSSCFR